MRASDKSQPTFYYISCQYLAHNQVYCGSIQVPFFSISPWDWRALKLISASSLHPPPPPPFSQPHSAYSIDGRSIIDDDSVFLLISLVYWHISKHFQGSDKWRRRHSRHTLMSYLSTLLRVQKLFIMSFPLGKKDTHNTLFIPFSILIFHVFSWSIVSRCLYYNGRLRRHSEQMFLLIHPSHNLSR